MHHWLVKSEPEVYGFQDLQREGTCRWDGVRNYQARNYLRQMALGDQVLFYHSREGLAVVGLCEVVRTAYPDPTAEAGDWSAVDMRALQPLPSPVTLATIKADPTLQGLALVRNPRLSVMPVPPDAFAHILTLGQMPKP